MNDFFEDLSAHSEPSEIIIAIINENKKLMSFWKSSFGWAPLSSATLLFKSRLDWQVSLSESLIHWIHGKNISNGDLILAWANLGALVEGSLKLFLSIFYEDYRNDINCIKKKDKIINPDVLKFEQIRQFLKKSNLLNEHAFFIEKVQSRRNAIHAYQEKDIGNYNEFIGGLESYLDLILDIKSLLPDPN